MSIPPPPSKARPGRLTPDLAPAPVEAPQNLSTSNQKRWVDLSFKVTEDERDDFRLEAAKRRMSHKELLQAALTLYREQFPTPDR